MNMEREMQEAGMSEIVKSVAKAVYEKFEDRPVYAQAQMNVIIAEELACAAIAAMRPVLLAKLSRLIIAPEEDSSDRDYNAAIFQAEKTILEVLK